jgi:putative drug exporter of the RND superfamily
LVIPALATVSHVSSFMFGLPVDDEVFRVGQITHPCAPARTTTASSSRIGDMSRVTAALIMVFVSFRLNGNPPVKQFGVGLTVAVILEVTAVR